MLTFKDYLIKIIVALIWAAVAWYAVWLHLQDASLMQAWWEGNEMIAIIFVVVIWLFLLWAAVKESMLPNNRRGILLFGVGVIWSAHVYLLDSPEQMVYLRDVMKLVWVFLCIAGPMKLLQSAKYEEKKFEQEVEVIEV